MHIKTQTNRAGVSKEKGGYKHTSHLKLGNPKVLPRYRE